MHETIELDRAGQIAMVTLYRPNVRNAFNAQMIAELTEVFTELASSPVKAVVLRGAGASFSAGADVNWMRASLDFTPEQNLEDALRMSDMFAAIDSLPKPVVARVHGAALGGGMGLIAVCDVVVAEEGTVFGFTEAKLGIIPAVISRFVLPKIGPSWARALYLTAERFGPELAQRIGLVHWVAPSEELDRIVDQKVRELLSSAPEAIREAKKLVATAMEVDLIELRDYTAARIAALRSGPEGQEGLRAFLEKRDPSWRTSV
jgi:methylglutaconyl-CoA hydratase